MTERDDVGLSTGQGVEAGTYLGSVSVHSTTSAYHHQRLCARSRQANEQYQAGNFYLDIGVFCRDRDLENMLRQHEEVIICHFNDLMVTSIIFDDDSTLRPVLLIATDMSSS